MFVMFECSVYSFVISRCILELGVHTYNATVQSARIGELHERQPIT